MPTAHALRLCPDLILVPPDRALYRRMHALMRGVTDRLFPATEWTSIDEFYAETTDLQSLYAAPETLGRKVKDAIFDATGLRCTIGVATGKVIAKVAADAHKPDGLGVIVPGSEAAFLAPKPVAVLPGVGAKTAEALASRGVQTIADLLDPRVEQSLRRLWGSRLSWLQALARGIDEDPVVPDREAKSVSHETTFDENTADLAFLERTLRAFLGALTHELRIDGLAAGSFTVKLKDAKFRITTRQRHFPKPLNFDPPMWKAIRPALHGLVDPRAKYRLAGLALGDLVAAVDSLFDGRTNKALAAMDEIISKHGTGVMRLGALPEEE
jgi:nucleotidyltransferase/DNA polymerase involved in DNA repair